MQVGVAYIAPGGQSTLSGTSYAGEIAFKAEDQRQKQRVKRVKALEYQIKKATSAATAPATLLGITMKQDLNHLMQNGDLRSDLTPKLLPPYPAQRSGRPGAGKPP